MHKILQFLSLVPKKYTKSLLIHVWFFESESRNLGAGYTRTLIPNEETFRYDDGNKNNTGV